VPLANLDVEGIRLGLESGKPVVVAFGYARRHAVSLG
jgi:hypothetical protein